MLVFFLVRSFGSAKREREKEDKIKMLKMIGQKLLLGNYV